MSALFDLYNKKGHGYILEKNLGWPNNRMEIHIIHITPFLCHLLLGDFFIVYIFFLCHLLLTFSLLYLCCETTEAIIYYLIFSANTNSLNLWYHQPLCFMPIIDYSPVNFSLQTMDFSDTEEYKALDNCLEEIKNLIAATA